MKKLYVVLMFVFLFKASYSQSWVALPGGSLNGQPNTMISFGGYRWFSGGFSTAGMISSIAIARHDGTGWVSTPPLAGAASSFCIWNNELYGAGSFTVGPVTYGAVKWNGTGWDYFGVISNGDYFHTVTIFNSQLVFGGRAFSVDGVSINHLAKWNGVTWAALPFTITCSWLSLPNIRTVKGINNYLYIGGDFSDINGTPSALAFKTDGTSVISLSLEPNYYVSDFTKYHDSVFCTGNFTFGPFPFNDGSPGIVKTENVTWHQVKHGFKMRGLSMCTSAVGLYVGGVYNSTCYNNPCNHDDVGNLGKWDGLSWSNESSGLFNQGNEIINFVYADMQTNLTYAIGDFLTSRGDIADYIAVKQSFVLPVRISSFTAQLGAEKEVVLKWRDETPEDNVVIKIQVSSDDNNFHNVGQIIEQGNKNDYIFKYQSPNCGKLFFRLEFDNGNHSDTRPISIPCDVSLSALKQLVQINTKYQGILYLYNTQGQVVLKKDISAGYTGIPTTVPIGLYVATFVGINRGIYTQKLFVR